MGVLAVVETNLQPYETSTKIRGQHTNTKEPTIYKDWGVCWYLLTSGIRKMCENEYLRDTFLFRNTQGIYFILWHYSRVSTRKRQWLLAEINRKPWIYCSSTSTALDNSISWVTKLIHKRVMHSLRYAGHVVDLQIKALYHITSCTVCTKAVTPGLSIEFNDRMGGLRWHYPDMNFNIMESGISSITFTNAKFILLIDSFILKSEIHLWSKTCSQFSCPYFHVCHSDIIEPKFIRRIAASAIWNACMAR